MYNSRFCRRLSSRISYSFLNTQCVSDVAWHSRPEFHQNTKRIRSSWHVVQHNIERDMNPRYGQVSLRALQMSCQYQLQGTHRTVPLSIRIPVPTTRNWQQLDTKDSQTPTCGRKLMSDSRQSAIAPRNIIDPVALVSPHKHPSTYGSLTPLGLPREVIT